MPKNRMCLVLGLFLLFLTACVRQVALRVPVGHVSRDHPAETWKETGEGAQQAEKAVPSKSPGEVASVSLMEQARRYLDAGDAESAIRILEQSIALNPYNGRGYYLLAEAWILKKDPKRALSFNRMARSYLKGDAAWEKRIREQYRKIKLIQ